MPAEAGSVRSGWLPLPFYIGLLQAVGKGIVEVGINQGYEFVMLLQYNQRLRDVRHVIQFAFYLFDKCSVRWK